MPELPEVQTVLSTLEYQMGYPRIKDIQILYEKTIHGDVNEFIHKLKNETIIAYHRWGKYLIFECEKVYFITHLRMEGKFYLQDQLDPYDKHVHVIFTLDDHKQLRYHDTRKFGRMYVYDKKQDYRTLDVFKNVGLDAFDENLTYMDLYKESRRHSYTLKQFLLDQKNMAGVGNIYADEICFACGLHPKSKVNKLSKKDFETILKETRRILNGAIQSGGTTIRSYTSSLGVDGRFQLKLKVHEKKGEVCPRCGGIIEKIQLNGRGTCFCKTCQKKK